MERGIDYLNLDLLIERSGRSYRARILNSPAGEVPPSTLRLPFGKLELENFVLRMGRPRITTRGFGRDETQVAKDFGGRLFSALFREELGVCLRSSLEIARNQSLGLRLRLRLSEAPQLANIPWEYLYDPTEGRFVALSDRTPVVRYVDMPRRVQSLGVAPPLRILVLASTPVSLAKLDVEREWSLVENALAPLHATGRVHVDRLRVASMAELQRQLRRGEYHIFHFIGHGGFDDRGPGGTLVLEDADQKAAPVTSEHLATVLCDHVTLRLVVLNACEGARTDERDPFAGVAQRLVQQGIPAVVAMQFEITDQAAIAFTQIFYEALADSLPVDTAVAQARKAILGATNAAEWGTPVLYMRSPDGHIFQIADFSSEATNLPAQTLPVRSPADFAPSAATGAKPPTTDGADAFEKTIAVSKDRHRPGLLRMLGWARGLEADGLARLVSVQGKYWPVLRIYVPGEMSLVVLYNDPGSGARLSAFRSMFVRLASNEMRRLEAVIRKPLSQGGYIPTDDAVLEIVRNAYRTAAGASADRERRTSRWTEPDFLSRLETLESRARPVAERILGWVHKRGDLVVLGNDGLTYAQLSCHLARDPSSLLTLHSDNLEGSPLVKIPFKVIASRAPYVSNSELRDTLLNSLRPLVDWAKGDPPPNLYVGWARLAEDAILERLLELVGNYIDRVKAGT
jgi:hypothetical protein